MPWWALVLLVFGVNVTLWGSMGLLRLLEVGVVRHGRRKAARRLAALRPATTAIPPPTVPGQGRRLRTGRRQAATHGDHRRPVAGRRQPAKRNRAGKAAPRPVRRRWQPVPAPRRTRIAARSATGRRHPIGRPTPPAKSGGLSTDHVAVLIPAHNEAAVIADTLRAITEHVPARNVHVVSDASTDATVAIARASGVAVIETTENLGKAGALEQAIGRFRLVDRFPVVMLLDADTRVQPGYFAAALPMFDNPEVVAVAGCVRTDTDRALSFIGHILVGHRRRIYSMGQRLVKFGQTWLRINATHIVPGFASLYRTDVLTKIEMNPPGLVIEDFNMTFEVYAKRLGKVGFSLSAVAVTQDPDNFRDYVRQTKRWALGLWQTVRRHRPRANLFTVMVWLLLLEMLTSSVLFLVLPLLLLFLGFPELLGGAVSWPVFKTMHAVLAAHLTLGAIGYGVVLPDLAMTVGVAIVERRPSMLVFAAFFPVMRFVDAAIGLYAIPLTLLSKSNGRWQSPTRRAAATAGAPAGRPGGFGRRPTDHPTAAAGTVGDRRPDAPALLRGRNLCRHLRTDMPV